MIHNQTAPYAALLLRVAASEPLRRGSPRLTTARPRSLEARG